MADAAVRLRSHLVSAALVDEPLAGALFAIFARHYSNVTWSRFLADLRDKDHVLLLRGPGPGGPVRGFSTQKIMRARVEGREVRAVFSGDTVIDRAYWGEQQLVRSWCRYSGAVWAEVPECPLYWLLISKGHRTYLYLPLFFRRYAPRPDGGLLPFEEAVGHALAVQAFGPAYRPEAGILEFPRPLGNLVPELAEIPPGRRRDPRVAFFLARNPGYRQGTELVCLAPLEPGNLKGLAGRAFRDGARLGSVASLAADTEARLGLDRAAFDPPGLESPGLAPADHHPAHLQPVESLG